MRRFTASWRGEGEAFGRVALPVEAGAATPYGIHPALLDACFHVTMGASVGGEASAAERDPWVPVGAARLRLPGPPGRLSGTLWCHVRVTSTAETSERAQRRTADLVVFDAAGAAVLELEGLIVQRLADSARRPEDDWLLGLAWDTSSTPAEGPSKGRFLLLGDGGGLAASLCRTLEGGGHAVAMAVADRKPSSAKELRVDDRSAAGVRALLSEVFDGAAPTAIVHLRSLEEDDLAEVEARSACGGLGALEAAVVRGCDSVLHTVQAMTTMGWRDAPRLWLVTRGAQAVVKDDRVSVEQAPLFGFGRVIAMEHPDLACTRIDLDPAAPASDAETLGAELVADDREEEIAWRGGERRVARLARIALNDGPVTREEPARGRAFGLEIDKPGVLDRLALRERERRPPAAGEVEIAVEAAGLNFLDVLLAMGVMPGDGDVAGATVRDELGAECAGRVVAVGPGVDLAVGDSVVALARGAIGSHVTTPRLFVKPRPASLTAAQAAAMPVAYLTAWYGLEKVGRLRKGERVLIHSATGGVGLAAVQWAQHVGAEVYATAGNAYKRRLLQELGVRFVSDSRTDAFVSDVLEWTDGQGVDVVLNSLSGDMIEKSFGLLRSYGRFVEIGKTDYYANHALGLRPFLKNLSFSLVDLRGMMRERPEVVSALFEELLSLFADGTFAPPKVATVPMADASEAFRTMARAEHTGKIVLTLDGAASVDTRVHARVEGVSIRKEGTYLVTGGLGGLGLAVAEWLAERGAGHLVLAGRAGVTTEAQREAIVALQASGAAVSALSLDVADRAAVAAALANIPADRPLRGVIHAAGLLDDGLLPQQTKLRFRAVMSPKMWGAWNLHQLTRAMDLDFFVLYGSASGLFGSPGQANYAAANTFLDALAHHRRALGLPALALDWGAFSGVGLAAAQDNRGQRLEGRGMTNLTTAQGLDVLARALDGGLAQVGVVPLDVRQFAEFYPAMAASRLFSRLMSAHVAGPRPAGDKELLDRVARVEGNEGRRDLLVEFLKQKVSQVLRIAVDKLDVDAPLTSLGMDSLMGLELRNRIEAALGTRLPATALWTYPTVRSFGAHLLGVLGFASADEGPVAAAPDDAELEHRELTRLRSLTTDEQDSLFDERLALLAKLVSPDLESPQ